MNWMKSFVERILKNKVLCSMCYGIKFYGCVLCQ